MKISFLGSLLNDPIFYGLLISIMVIYLGCGIVKFINDILNLVWKFKDRKKNKNKD